MRLSLHVYPFAVADGPTNMARDELLLEKARQGLACFRWYGWQPATLSLGYFQPQEERLHNPRWLEVPWVRRSTGGGAIWHDDEKTYALSLPVTVAAKKPPAAWHEFLHETMAAVLRQKGCPATVLQGQRPKRTELDYLCFTVPQPGDVLESGRKIIGGAQRLKHGALLQHGSVIQPFGDLLAVNWLQYLAQHLDCQLVPTTWTETDHMAILRLAEEKYRHLSWNSKR